FRVIQAGDGEGGLDAVRDQRPRLVVLDVGLPGAIDGLEVCRRLRASDDIPILMLTARDGEIDRVLGLELGADDYVPKPFPPRELVARVKAVLRRAKPGEAPSEDDERLAVGPVRIDGARRAGLVGEQPVALTARE